MRSEQSPTSPIEIKGRSLAAQIERLKREFGQTLVDSGWQSVTESGLLEETRQTPLGLHYIFNRSVTDNDTLGRELTIFLPDITMLTFKFDAANNLSVRTHSVMTGDIDLILTNHPSRDYPHSRHRAPHIRFASSKAGEFVEFRDQKAIAPAKIFAAQIRDVLTSPISDTQQIGGQKLPEGSS